MQKSADSFSDISYGLLQRYERMDKVSLSRIIRGILGVVAFAIIAYSTKNIPAAIGGVAILWFIIFIFVDISYVRAFEQPRPVFSWRRQLKLAVFALPLGITMAITSLHDSIPRYITERYLNTAQLGYFGALAYFIAAFRIGLDAVGPSALPRLAHYFNENIKAYILLICKMVLLGAMMGMVGVVFAICLGRPFLAIVYKADYAQYNVLFIWIMIAGGVGYISSMLSVGLTATRQFHVQIPLAAFVAIVIFLAGLFFIPKFGTIGIAWTMLVGTTTQCVATLLVLIQKIIVQKAVIEKIKSE